MKLFITSSCLISYGAPLSFIKSNDTTNIFFSHSHFPFSFSTTVWVGVGVGVGVGKGRNLESLYKEGKRQIIVCGFNFKLINGSTTSSGSLKSWKNNHHHHRLISIGDQHIAMIFPTNEIPKVKSVFFFLIIIIDPRFEFEIYMFATFLWDGIQNIHLKKKYQATLPSLSLASNFL